MQGKEPSDPDKKDISSRDLYRVLRSQKRILLVDAWENQSYKDSLRQLIQEFYIEDWEIEVKDHLEVTKEELSRSPALLLGAPDQNRWITRVIKELPFSVTDDKISVAAHQFDAQSHSLVLAYYPNPLQVKMPVGLYVSQNEALIWELVQSRINSFFRANWQYEIVNEEQRVLLGNFSQDPNHRWEVDLNQLIQLPNGLVNQWKSGPFNFNSYHEDLNQSSMTTLAATCRRELSQIEEFTGKRWDSGSIDYYLYPSTEIKGLITGNTDQSHMDTELLTVYTAFDEHFQDRYFGKENQLILRELLDTASFKILEIGLAVYFCDTWQQKGHMFWASHLIEAGNAINIEQLLDRNQVSGFSSIAVEATAGSLVEFLLSYWGKDQFLQRYQHWKPDLMELKDLDNAWQDWVESQDFQRSANQQITLPYLQGFNFTHEGYQIYNGYGSALSSTSMQRLSNLGSNAVAIVPYSWMRDPRKPSVLRFSDRAGTENDEGVIHAINQAKRNGMLTLLKPHVWISNGWPGDVEMESKQDWDLFFNQYFHWISHYALLAEMHEVEALCIGVEFSKATLAQEKKWRELISKLRGIYHGKLTYAANWGDEFEGIQFWDQLDFIGLNCYYPLSSKNSVNKDQLEQGFTEVLHKVNTVKVKFSKPVVITEIGFRSIESPWKHPHAEAGAAAFNEDHQAMCYEAVFQATSRFPIVDGIFWWKWPTNPEMQYENDRRFVPSGKMAEAVIKNWF